MAAVTLRWHESGVEIASGTGTTWKELAFDLYNRHLPPGSETRGLLRVIDGNDPNRITVQFARRLVGTPAIDLDPRVRVEIIEPAAL